MNADVNGYTWDIINGAGTSVGTGSQLYGATAGQFGVQAMMYTQYYMKHLDLELTLS